MSTFTILRSILFTVKNKDKNRMEYKLVKKYFMIFLRDYL